MDNKTEQALRLISVESLTDVGPQHCQGSLPHANDTELLDAYSRAVTAVVDVVGPSVVSISVDLEGPAGRAGLMRGDIVVAVNGKAVTDVDDLHHILVDWPIGEPLVFSIVRWQERKEVSVMPAEVPAET